MRELLAGSLETMPRVGYWMADAEGEVICSRGQALALAGMTPQQMEGTSILDRVDRDGTQVYRWGEDAVRIHRAAMERATGTEHLHRNGREIWQSWAPIYEDGRPKGLSVVYMDVTGMRDTELTAVIRELTVLAPDIQELAREKTRALRLASEAHEAHREGRARWQEWVITTATSVGRWFGRHSGTPLERLLWLLAGVVALAIAAWLGVPVAHLFELLQPDATGGQLP